MKLTKRQLDVLNHVVVDGIMWANNVKDDAHVLAKVAKYESAYDQAVSKGNYLNRKQRDEEEERLRREKYDNVPWNKKRQREYPSLSECIHAILDNEDGELDALQAKRKIVKERHPKGGN